MLEESKGSIAQVFIGVAVITILLLVPIFLFGVSGMSKGYILEFVVGIPILTIILLWINKNVGKWGKAPRLLKLYWTYLIAFIIFYLVALVLVMYWYLST